MKRELTESMNSEQLLKIIYSRIRINLTLKDNTIKYEKLSEHLKATQENLQKVRISICELN